MSLSSPWILHTSTEVNPATRVYASQERYTSENPLVNKMTPK